jgi:alkylresorcinol/alkylpyrone synthase/polyketide synthase Type III
LRKEDLRMTVDIADTRPDSRTSAAAPPSLSPVPNASTIAGVGTAVSSTPFSQHDLLDAFAISDPKVRSVFLNSAIERRFLDLPRPASDGIPVPETQADLLDRHKTVAVDMGVRALRACLDDAGAKVSDIRHLCCVTSTGFLAPGLSALLIRELDIDRDCSRADIVGMGCNAGLNALNVVSGWSVANPGELAVLLCTEACSAAYVLDSSMRTAVVNSLFGDGAAALAVVGRPGGSAPGSSGRPRILKFASCIIPEAIDAMRYDWDSVQNRFSFFLDPQIPYVVGAHVEFVVDRLLTNTGLLRSDITHWLVHSGGKKVIDAVMVNLGLSRYDVRHTTGVLRDFGNVSSGSFLFSYERLQQENVTAPGDYGVLMTMGPGSTIETALIQW